MTPKPFPQQEAKWPTYLLLLLVVSVILAILVISRQAPEPAAPEPGMRDQLLTFKAQIYDAMENGKCIGYLKHYTKTGFIGDLGAMKQEYDEKYSADDNNFSTAGNNLLPPAALGMSQAGYDCEDFTLAAYCLAALYPNVSCKLYASVKEDGVGHIGAVCEETIGNITYQQAI